MAAHGAKEATSGFWYTLKRILMYAFGKESSLGTGEMLHEVMNQSGGLFSGLGRDVVAHVPVGILGMGLAGSVSAALTQMDYHHKRNNLKNQYGDELALKLEKSPAKLKEGDIDTLAKDNAVVKEHLQKYKRQRNWGVLFSVMATLASLGVVLFALDTAAIANVGGKWLSTAAKLVAGVLTYNVVKQPLHYFGDRLFKIDEQTTHDRIATIRRDRDEGRQITREQIASVYASARPEVDNFVVAQFGDHFDELSIIAKQSATEYLSQHLPLDQLKDAINKGTHNPTELAFSVQGDISGVVHAPTQVAPKKPHIIGIMLNKIRHAVRRPQLVHIEEQVISDNGQAAASVVAYQDEIPTRSFVKQLGLTPMEAGMTQLQRLQQRGQATSPEIPPP